MKQVLKIIIGLGFIILLAIFVEQNKWILDKGFAFSFYGRQTPPINFLVLLLGSIILGALVSSIIMLVGQVGLKRTLKKTEKNISRMEKELNSLRNLPIIEDDKIADNVG